MQIPNLDFLLEQLKRKGIFISAKTIKKHQYQGWMSIVFTADSNIGPLIIHLVRLVEEHKRNKVWEKFSGLAKIFAHNPEVPTARILYAGIIEDTFALVQNYLTGVPAGKRILEKNVISDVWQANKNITVQKILYALTKIHKMQLKGFGWPVLANDSLAGPHKTWKMFFKKEVPRWTGVILETDRKLSEKSEVQNLEPLAQKIVAQIDYNGPAALIHGDAINPNNVLINNDNKIFLLDWEWSICGDPAWEFCDLGWWNLSDRKNLSAYFKALGVKDASEQEYFLRRIRLYIPLWLLWGTQMHAHDSDLSVYLALRKLLRLVEV